MALEPILSAEPMESAPADTSAPWDAAKAAGAGLTDLAAQAVGAGADVAGVKPDSGWRDLQSSLNEVTQAIDESMSPANRDAMNAEVNPDKGAQSIFNSPARSVLMKGARMAPMLLGALLLPEGWAGVAAGSSFFGAQGAAQQLNESRKRVQNTPDATLQEVSPIYRGLREDNDETQAREKLIAAQNDVRTLLIAGGSQAIGGGALGHALKGKVAGSFLQSIGLGAVEGAAGGAAAGGGMEIASQRGEKQAGLRDSYDPEEIARKAWNAGFEMSALGAAAGTIRPREGGAAPKADAGAKTDPSTVDPAQKAAMDAANPSPDGPGTTSETSAAPAEAPAAGGGALQQAIEQERARMAAETAKPPEMAPPDAGPPSPEAPAQGAPPAEPAAPPLTAGEVQGAALPQKPGRAPAAPNPMTDMAPLPPTDRQMGFGRPSKKPPERTAVPLTEEDPHLAGLNDALKAVTQKQEVTRTGKVDLPTSDDKAINVMADLKSAGVDSSHPIADELLRKAGLDRADYVRFLERANRFEPAEALALQDRIDQRNREQPYTPPKPRAKGKVTDVEEVAAPAKPAVSRVLRSIDKASLEAEAKAAAERKARDVAITADARKEQQAAERRERRQRNEVAPNEERAAEVVKGSHPEDVDTLQTHHAQEDAALGAQPAAAGARRALRDRALAVLARADEAGVTIPLRTTWSKDAAARGEKNPTPYTSRLIELTRFVKAFNIAERMPDMAKREAHLKHIVVDHVRAERALRAGDLQAAAAPRLETNRALDESHSKGRAAELERLKREQADDAHADEEHSVSAEEAAYEMADPDEPEQLYHREGRGEKSDAEHYKLPPTGVRRTTVREELTRFKRQFQTLAVGGKGNATRGLVGKILDKLIEYVGDQKIHVASDEMFGAMASNDPHTNGVFNFYKRGALQDGQRGDIWIRNETLHTADGPHVMLHEVAHAATAHALEANHALRFDVEELARAVAALHPETGKMYGIRANSPHEFLAEALSNPRFQRYLIDTPAPKEIIQHLKLGRAASLWQALTRAIAKAFGLGEHEHSVMDAILRVSDELMDYDPPITLKHMNDLQGGIARQLEHTSLPIKMEDIKSQLADRVDHMPGTLRSKLRSFGYKLSTVEQLAQLAEKHFGATQPVQRLRRAMARIATEKENIIQGADHQLVVDMAALDRKYAASGQFAKFADLLNDETMAGVFADRPHAEQKHLGGKDNMKTWQARAQHADLAKRWAALPADLKAMRSRLHDYFRNRQNDLSLARIKNIVRVVNDGVPNDALANKIFTRTLDEAEKKVIEKDGVLKAINDARALNKISGPYVPLMRRGEHVVSGRYDVTSPGNASRLNGDGEPDVKGNVFEFKTRADAKAFTEGQDLHVSKVEKVYTDPKTGERWADDGEGGQHKLTKRDASDGQADERYRVHVQDKHLEFFESEREARQRHAELKAQGRIKLDGVAPKRWEPGGSNASFMSEAFRKADRSLRQRAGFRELDESTQKELVRHLQEMSLQALASTRAHSQRLPRTNVAGASADILRNTGQYASSSAGYLSRLKHQPEVDAALKEMTDFNDEHRFENTERTYPRGLILRELKQRLYSQGEPERNSFWHNVGSRLLQISYLDKLASPAFHIINAQEPWIVSLPTLGGRHGIGRTMAALHRAYSDIGASNAVGQGLRDTGRALRQETGFANYTKRFVDRLKDKPDGKHVAELLDRLAEMGVTSRDAGMELGRISNPSSNVAGRALDKADLMARQMGTAIESINRTVTAIAAYRLEFAKTKDHAKAIDYAERQVIDTMGDYSGWNAPPVFNHGLGRMALQFKKYAQKTYWLLGKTAGQALRGDKEAMKAFAGLMATHMAVAGALGLPLEAIKAALLAANLAGVTTTSYDDFERGVRGLATKAVGPSAGQALTRGIPRWLGVDTSSRQGLENLIMPFGFPKSMKQEDLMKYAASAYQGAPLSMLEEYPAGMQALWKGDFAKAAEKLLPIKLVADAAQAYQRATTGKVSASGRQTLSPYTATEAAIKALGFTPGREAEAGEERAATSDAQHRLKVDRGDFAQRWAKATASEKAAVWRDVLRWNEHHKGDSAVTMKELNAGLERRHKEEQAGRGSVQISKRDRAELDQRQFYNTH